MILDTTDSAVALDEAAEAAFYAMAEETGLLITTEEAAALARLSESAPEVLVEMQSIVRLNQQAKLDSLTVRSALLIARQKKDPVFAKYAKAADLKRKLRGLIVQKYQGSARTTARKLLMSAGKKNLVVAHSVPGVGNPDSRV